MTCLGRRDIAASAGVEGDAKRETPCDARLETIVSSRAVLDAHLGGEGVCKRRDSSEMVGVDASG